MTLGEGGAFECSWKGINNVLFRAGRKYNETQTHSQIGTFTIDFEVPTFNLPGGSGSKNAYISVYGWLSGGSPDDLIEYYIIERFGEFNPKNSSGAIARGSATIDGATYEFYEVPRKNAPSIKGDRDFKQYFSIRSSGSARNSGTISVTQHFNAWATNGLSSMNNAKLYEVALKVESYSNGPNYLAEGNAKVTKNILKVNGTPIQ
jgi:endo-1,4-beta-xylanase